MDRSTLRTSTPSGTESTVGAKLRMLVTPASTSRSQTSWAAAAGVAITPMATLVLADDLLELVEARTGSPPTTLTQPGRVGVEQGDDPEAAGGEAGVVGQGVTEVPDADDDDRPVLGDADLAGDLVAEVLHVVADAAGAVGAEVGEVLAQLGAVDPGGRGQLLAGAGADAALGEGDQGPQVDRQPGDGGLGDSAVGGLRRQPCGDRGGLGPGPAPREARVSWVCEVVEP